MNEVDTLALFDASSAQGEEGLSRYLARFLATCLDLFGATSASLFRRSEIPGQFRLADGIGSHRPPAGATVVSGIGIAGVAIELGRPLLVDDVADARELRGRQVEVRTDLVSAMVVPLCTPRGDCLGVVNLSREVGRPPFARRDLAKATRLVGHLALALDNAELVADLNSARRSLRAVLDSLSSSVVVVGRDANVVDLNTAATPLAGYVGRPWSEASEVLPVVLAAAADHGLREALLGHDSAQEVHDPLTQRWWMVRTNPIPDGGATVSFEETTENRRRDRELQQARHHAENGQMAATVAHEIRNPLTGIQSAANLLPEAPDHLPELHEIIVEEVARMNSLCDDFLDLARPVNLRPAAIDLFAIAGGLLRRMEAMATEAGVRLTLSGEATKAIGDAGRIEQALRNLVQNAIQASAPGAEVAVEVTPEALRVRDRGVGMSTEALANLFKPFFTTKNRGTGLGLTMTRRIVEAHGWRIEAESEVGAGTVFTIHISGDCRV